MELHFFSRFCLPTVAAATAFTFSCPLLLFLFPSRAVSCLHVVAFNGLEVPFAAFAASKLHCFQVVVFSCLQLPFSASKGWLLPSGSSTGSVQLLFVPFKCCWRPFVLSGAVSCVLVSIAVLFASGGGCFPVAAFNCIQLLYLHSDPVSCLPTVAWNCLQLPSLQFYIVLHKWEGAPITPWVLESLSLSFRFVDFGCLSGFLASHLWIPRPC